jgi:hypothetical protein
MSDELELRPSDADREQAAVRLREACAEGRLTLEELSQRLDGLYLATTGNALAELTRDLPATPAPRNRRRHTWLAVCVFANFVRRGRLRLGRHLVAISVFGDLDLDLRHAQLEGDHATIWALACFGNVDIYVPEAAETEALGIALFGHRREFGDDLAAGPAAPFLRIVSLGFFGTLDVWHVPPGIAGGYRDVIRAVEARDRQLAR